MDESGDHSMTSIDANYPVFSLAFCIFKKSDYLHKAVPLMQEFKFKWFGHDTIVMHEADIVRRRGAFGFLQFDKLRDRFMDDLSAVIEAMPMTVFASVIRKENLKKKYANPENPYQLGLLFCMEMAHKHLKSCGAHGDRCHIICESRSPRLKEGTGKEDAALELEFRRIVAGDHYLQRPGEAMPCFELVFASKLANSTGLQIADLIARPLGLRVFRGDQQNRAYKLIFPKIAGMKVFP